MTNQVITTDTTECDGAFVEGQVYPIDNAEEIAIARAAMRAAGLTEATIYEGTDGHITGAVLLAAEPYTAAHGRV